MLELNRYLNLKSKVMKRLVYFLTLLVILLAVNSVRSKVQAAKIKWNEEWPGRIYPPEHKITIDSVSGAKIIFATTNPSKDLNFYFDWNCWFNDLSCMFWIR